VRAVKPWTEGGVGLLLVALLTRWARPVAMDADESGSGIIGKLERARGRASLDITIRRCRLAGSVELISRMRHRERGAELLWGT